MIVVAKVKTKGVFLSKGWYIFILDLYLKCFLEDPLPPSIKISAQRIPRKEFFYKEQMF